MNTTCSLRSFGPLQTSYPRVDAILTMRLKARQAAEAAIQVAEDRQSAMFQAGVNHCLTYQTTAQRLTGMMRFKRLLEDPSTPQGLKRFALGVYESARVIVLTASEDAEGKAA